MTQAGLSALWTGFVTMKLVGSAGCIHIFHDSLVSLKEL